MQRLAFLFAPLLCVGLIHKSAAQDIEFEGNWTHTDEDKGDFIEITQTDDNYVVERVAFSVMSQSMGKDRYPAFREGGSLSIRAPGGSIPVLYERDTDTLTVDGRQTYRRTDENIDDASTAWMAARKARRAENKRVCEELEIERDSREVDARQDPETWAAFKEEMKARTPKGCLMPVLF